MAAIPDRDALDAWRFFEIELREEEQRVFGNDDEVNAFAREVRAAWPECSAQFRRSIQKLVEDYESSGKKLREAITDRDRMQDAVRVWNSGVLEMQEYANHNIRVTQAREPHLKTIRPLFNALREETFPSSIGQLSVEYLRGLWEMNQATLKAEQEAFAEMDRKLKARRVLDKRLMDVGFPRSWQGSWLIGKGAFGKATVWVERDAGIGIIKDRILIKDTDLSDEDWWWPGQTMAHPADPTRVIPIEAFTMLQLRSREGASECIVRLRQWKADPIAKKHRLYLEYCPFGDLEQFTRAYISARRAFVGSLTGMNPAPTAPGFIAESFIWHTFESMAVAGTLLSKGELDGSQSIWDTIVHRDWKLANVFLAEPLESRYRGYPVPKLGDFGLACVIPQNKSQSTIPRTLGNCGTIGTRAVEQKTRPDLVSSATNVWSVGFQIWGLIRLSTWSTELDWDWTKGVRKLEPDFRPEEKTNYSKELLGLVDRCCAYNPKNRISFKDLLRDIRANTTGPNDLANGARAAPADSDEFKSAMLLPTDKWARGFPLDEGMEMNIDNE
ncbi:hypothetical protein LTR08_006272 [Meristemomyces frigidus]|nr:hypothetical protein LTR08_006272 [Meristemomyces frigidus]